MADVVVVGAGIAGLACARRLSENGVDTIVLEGRDRVGGRVRTHVFANGEHVELGAMFVHGRRASIVALLRDAGLSFTSPWEGDDDDEVVEDDTGFWSVEPAVAALGAPDVPLRAALEAAGWPRERISSAVTFFEEIWCADVDRLSAQGVARVERGWTSGPDNLVVAEGFGHLPAYLARDLAVELSTPVDVVVHGDGRATARAADGRGFDARAIVVTVPPSLVAEGRIRFEPQLPAEKITAARAIPIGPVTRAAVRVRRSAPQDWFRMSDDGGWWSTRKGSCVVTAWIGGPRAARVSGETAEAMFEKVRRSMPWSRDAEVMESVIAEWGADPFSLGGYSYPAVGALDAPGRWAQPVDHTLFFAGEATCGDVHPATVHGAYDSGMRAADEVLASR